MPDLDVLVPIHDEIATVCPILSVVAPTVDEATWFIVFDEAATDEQKAAAQEMLDSYKARAKH
jgi:hypothetical protein